MKSLLTLFSVLALSAAPALAQVTATFTKYGTGCVSSGKSAPEIKPTTLPTVNGTLRATVSNLLPSSYFLVIAGTSDKAWRGLTLPADLAFLGAPGCKLYASGDCVVYCWNQNGTVAMELGVPNNKALSGQALYMQVMTTDKKNNAAEVAVSQGGKFIIGS